MVIKNLLINLCHFNSNIIMKKLIVVFGFLILTFSFHKKLAAQSDTLNFKGKSSLLFEMWGPEVIGGYFNYFINNRISANLGIGFDLDFHLGSNLYLIRRNKSRHSIYLSGQIISYNKNTISFIGIGQAPEPDRQLGFYLPIGYEYISKKGFTLQIDLGPNFVSRDWDQSNTKPIVFSFKTGKTFGLHYKK
jgi:hypothetical protein